MKKMISDFTFDDLNQFIEVVDEVYELAKSRVSIQNKEDDKEVLANCLVARRELLQHKQILLLNAQ